MSVARQEEFLSKGRVNQKERTRDALIEAALQLTRAGRSFTVPEVAAAARVSTATAYRYFPNPESLWTELAADERDADIHTAIEAAGDDPAARIDAAVSTVARMMLADETRWRGVLRSTLDRWFAQASEAGPRVPVRGERRLNYTRTALQPLDKRLTSSELRRLTMALMLVYGLEAFITTRDACSLESDEAEAIMRWAAQAILHQALAEHETRRAAPRARRHT